MKNSAAERRRTILIVVRGLAKMKLPPGMSATVTHNLIIADRSEGGMFAVATILDICPAAEGHISVWHGSTDRFFLFILEQKGAHIEALTARDLEHLSAQVLPELYADLLKPPANVSFEIFVEEPDDGVIEDRIAQLLIMVALEAGLSP